MDMWLPTLIAVIGLTFQTHVVVHVRIVVVDRDRPTQPVVAAEVYLVGSDNSERRLGATDSQGSLVMDQPCGSGARIRVKSPDRQYYVGLAECVNSATGIRVALQRIAYVQNLQKNAATLAANGHAADAALAYNELLMRVPDTGVDKVAIEKNLYQQLAKALGIKATLEFDKDDQRFLMGAELKNAVADFQRQKGLLATGVVDFKTLNEASNVSVSTLLFGRIGGG
jgi:hypothetical protein